MVLIVGTIGPSSWNENVLNVLNEKLGLVRFNGSWLDYDTFKVVRQKIKKPILLDIPGDRKKPRQKTLTDDMLINLAIQEKLNYIGLSYVRSAEEVHAMRKRLEGSNVKIVAKIETQEALQYLPEIVAAADMLLVDRGDLGTAIGFEKVPIAQVNILKECNKQNKPVITATEMMMSTLASHKPNCADVSDVFFAVYHGTNYVMLSEETAIGQNPIQTVEVMQKIIDEAVKHKHIQH